MEREDDLAITGGVEALVASFSSAMLELAASPMEALRNVSASPAADMEELASLERSLSRLAGQASLAASMAGLLATFAGGMRRFTKP